MKLRSAGFGAARGKVHARLASSRQAHVSVSRCRHRAQTRRLRVQVDIARHYTCVATLKHVAEISRWPDFTLLVPSLPGQHIRRHKLPSFGCLLVRPRIVAFIIETYFRRTWMAATVWFRMRSECTMKISSGRTRAAGLHSLSVMPRPWRGVLTRGTCSEEYMGK
jgi:hypothetical protein